MKVRQSNIELLLIIAFAIVALHHPNRLANGLPSSEKCSDNHVNLGWFVVGKYYIDLCIITHFDEDHSRGLVAYLTEDISRIKKFGELWINAPYLIKANTTEEVSAYNMCNKELIRCGERNYFIKTIK